MSVQRSVTVYCDGATGYCAVVFDATPAGPDFFGGLDTREGAREQAARMGWTNSPEGDFCPHCTTLLREGGQP